MSERIQIKASRGEVESLSGVGEEWLFDVTGEYVIARFWNGSLTTYSSPLSHNSVATDCDTVILKDAA